MNISPDTRSRFARAIGGHRGGHNWLTEPNPDVRDRRELNAACHAYAADPSVTHMALARHARTPDDSARMLAELRGFVARQMLSGAVEKLRQPTYNIAACARLNVHLEPGPGRPAAHTVDIETAFAPIRVELVATGNADAAQRLAFDGVRAVIVEHLAARAAADSAVLTAAFSTGQHSPEELDSWVRLHGLASRDELAAVLGPDRFTGVFDDALRASCDPDRSFAGFLPAFFTEVRAAVRWPYRTERTADGVYVVVDVRDEQHTGPPYLSLREAEQAAERLAACYYATRRLT